MLFITGFTPHGVVNVRDRNVVLSTIGFSNSLGIASLLNRMGPKDRMKWSFQGGLCVFGARSVRLFLFDWEDGDSVVGWETGQ